ncbi:MAG TPA: T9SS type A sorting domain-containing protein [Paludibacter sp.]|nr:T9SS type A sorting domain-containing protein [Paludibacter sp.]
MKTKLTLFFIFSFFYILSTTVTFAEEIKLGGYPFPTTTASFTATEVAANIQFNELSYTDSIMYDYNLEKGYFRPYKWPEGAKDTAIYLEFTLTPQNSSIATVNSLKIVHKPNTALLGPSKICTAYSTDGGENFINQPEVVIASRTSFNTDTINFVGLNSAQPVIFRLYAYESLYGTATQKDLWIIDYIELFGSVQENPSTSNKNLSKQVQVKSFYADGTLHLKGITEPTKLTVYDMLGNQLYQENLSADKSISLNYVDQLLIVKIETKGQSKSLKIIAR